MIELFIIILRSKPRETVPIFKHAHYKLLKEVRRIVIWSPRQNRITCRNVWASYCQTAVTEMQ